MRAGRAVASLHPRSVPVLVRASYRHELAAWCLLPLALGAIEGGVVSVIAKSVFAGSVPPRALNLAVAVLAGASAFTNVFSFLFTALNHGRPKVRFVVFLQVALSACLVLAAAAPRSPPGLVLFTACVVVARTFWTGVVTIRSTVWRANYPRHARARMAGRLTAVQALAMTLSGLAVGIAMKSDDDAFRLLFPVLAAAGFAGAWTYSAVRMRGQRALLRAERSDGGASVHLRPRALRRVLLEDGPFGRYMAAMFVFGSGNLMLTAPLVILLRDRFRMDALPAILIVSAIPTLLMPLTIPLWSRMFDRAHVVRFRAYHAWWFVGANALFLAATLAGQAALLWPGAVAKGVAFGGGVLGWNLGHHDFAPPQRASLYMAVHVTLTGIRGLLAPIIGVSLYELLESLRGGAGGWVLALCLALNLAGAIWFVAMREGVAGPGAAAPPPDGPTVPAPPPPV